jgi:hypothetical protein
MGFADKYLACNRRYGDFVSKAPEPDLKFIVVIPSYNEDNLWETLDSLWQTERPKGSAEVLVVVNSPLQAPDFVIDRNQKTIREVERWNDTHRDRKLRVFTIHTSDLPPNEFGAGLARKIGMDEAISRFNQQNNADGYIVSLDADTTVSYNYFQRLERSTEENRGLNAGILYFEHSLEGNDFPETIYRAVARYELFLRYYNQALRWTGFPYAFHTIGSAFLVRALAYVKQGGMIRRKAGEDFYFLNKIFQLGNIREINSTVVFPSPRISDRVLFGTGPEVKRMLRNSDNTYFTYNPRAFYSLREFFSGINELFHANLNQVENYKNSQHSGLRNFLDEVGFLQAIKRINDNCKRPEVFRKHFFQWFGGLKIIQYMHEVHEEDLPKIPVNEAACEMLNVAGFQHRIKEMNTRDPLQILKVYRDIERSADYRI